MFSQCCRILVYEHAFKKSRFRAVFMDTACNNDITVKCELVLLRLQTRLWLKEVIDDLQSKNH